MFQTLANPISPRGQPARFGQNSLKLAGAAVVAAFAAGLIVGFPALSSNSASDASVRAAAGIADGPALEAADCDRHSWPYLDQRCIDPAATGKELRQVRVISIDRVAPTMIVTTAAPIARVAPENSRPKVALAAPQASPNAPLQVAWAATPMQLALLSQGIAAKGPVRKPAGQTKAQSQTARVALAAQLRH